VLLLDGPVKTRKILHTTLAFVLIRTLTLMTLQTWALFIDEVSRTVITTFKLKNTLDNGIGIAAAASMFPVVSRQRKHYRIQRRKAAGRETVHHSKVWRKPTKVFETGVCAHGTASILLDKDFTLLAW